MTTQITSVLQKQITLRDLVSGLGDLKTSPYRRSQKLWKENSERAATMIDELKSKGVAEETHPIFKNAVIKYNYWTFQGTKYNLSIQTL